MKWLRLLLLCALPARAGDLPDGGVAPAQVVDGGCFLPTDRCIMTGKELALLRAENAALKESPPVTPVAAVVSFVVGVAVGGVVAGYVALQKK